jgi:hypothetical protein
MFSGGSDIRWLRWSFSEEAASAKCMPQYVGGRSIPVRGLVGCLIVANVKTAQRLTFNELSPEGAEGSQRKLAAGESTPFVALQLL